MPAIKFPDRKIFNDLTYFESALEESGRHCVFEVVAFIDRARRMQAAFIEAPYFPIEFPEISSGSYSLPQSTIGDLPELMAYLYDIFFSEMAPLQVNLPDQAQMLTEMTRTPENIRRPSEMGMPVLDLDFEEDRFVEMSSDDEGAGPGSRVKRSRPSMVIRPALPNAQPSLAEVSSARPVAKESPPLRARPVLSPEAPSFSLREIAEDQSTTDRPSDAEMLAQAVQLAPRLDIYGASLTETSLPLSADSRAAHMVDSVSATAVTGAHENARVDESRLSLQVHASSLTESPPFLPSVRRGVGLDGLPSPLADSSPQLAVSAGRAHVPSLSLTGITEESEGGGPDQARPKLDPTGRSLSSMAAEALPPLPAKRGIYPSPLADSSPQLAVSAGRAHVPSLSLTGITEESEDGGPSQARLRLDPTGRSLSSMAVEASPPLSARRGGASMSLDARFAALAGGGENLSADEKPYQPTQPLPDVLEDLAETGAESSPSLSAARMPPLSLANASSVSVTSVVVAKPFREVTSVEELADFMTAALKHLTLPYQLKSTRRREASSTLFADHAAEEEAVAAAPNPPTPNGGCCCWFFS
ncbi:hypothetical protein [Piscirickettsia salmonis]|uniref:hypothetical protein n=1 Tax=Piscirickettsia salmonis TaxID=1238 RepID=UPI0012BB18D8|nr:hypothetical protein [Piscirickettsia salmonis]QGP40512.1 hypothetical protein Psal182_02694 [Piscirickettsia salmonis]